MGINKTRKVEYRYDRIASGYDKAEYLMEQMFASDLRQESVSKLAGNVLEVGVGTGKNLQFYNDSAEITGIDISAKMLAKAREKADNINRRIELIKMDAQDLQFDSNTFDSVLGTFIFCSIPDPIKAMQEIKRVAKPNAEIIFIEHVLSKIETIALLENLINPIVSSTFGFNVNRDTKANIKKAGLIIEQDEKLALFDVFRRFTCTIS